MKTRRGVLVVFFVLITALGESPFAQDAIGTSSRNGSLRGEILPAAGETELPQIISIQLIGPGFQKVTFANGSRFEFDNLPEGTYLLSVRAEGRQETVVELHSWAPVNGERLLSIVLGPRRGEALPVADSATVDVRTLRVPEKAQNELAKAAEALEKNQPDKAEEHLLRAIEIYPDFYQARNNLGVLYVKRADLDRAEKEFAKAVELAPDNLIALKNLGYIRINRGQAAEAFEVLARASRLDPNDPHLETYLGEVCFVTKKFDQARQHLEKALVLDGKQSWPHYRLGYICLSQNEYDGALNHFRAFLDANPVEGRAEVQVEVTRLEQHFKDALARNAASPVQ